MRKGKVGIIVALVLMVTMVASVFVGCGGKKFEVEFLDGTKVLKTEKVTKGKFAKDYTPEKEGYNFKGWFATPSLKVGREFDFKNPITQKTSVFSCWQNKVFQEDTRDWMLVGESGMDGSLLFSSSWGKVTGDKKTPYVLSQAEGTNDFTITLDMYIGDTFQIAYVTGESFSFTNQCGFGYLTEYDSSCIKGSGNPFDDAANSANMTAQKAGSYTITLVTDIENSALNRIKIVRNGDPVVDRKKDYAPNLAGTITAGAAITDKAELGEFGLVYNEESKLYETTLSLNKGDYFAVLLLVNSWTDALRSADVSEKSEDVYDKTFKDNIKMTKSGQFKITLDLEIDEEIDTVLKKELVITRVGDFVRSAGDNEYQFKVSDSVTEKVFVKKGARVPNGYEGAEIVSKTFLGWYTDLEKNIPLNFDTTVTTEGETIEVAPKYMADADTDTRDLYLYGNPSGWKKNDPNFKLTKTGHIYTINFAITKAGDSVTFTIFEGDKDTSVVAKGNWMDYAASSIKIKTGEGNISFEDVGNFTATVNTFTKKIVITEVK